ncbi:MAG: ATP-dependent DNA ligase [Phycisphaerae bacterium]
MKRLCELYTRLDGTTRRSRKLDALRWYFRDAPSEDAVWTLFLLSGHRQVRAVSNRLLRVWASEESGYPLWLINETYQNIGDLSETLALLLPDTGDTGSDEGLGTVMRERVLSLQDASVEVQRDIVISAWRSFSPMQRFLFHKLISGAFRVGVGRSTVLRGFAEAHDLPVALVEKRLMGRWEATPAFLERVLAPGMDEEQGSTPLPFFLASPLERELSSLGDPAAWQVEWKWDGIRAQLVRHQDESFLWSRGEEPIHDQFPELVAASMNLPSDCILDGEVLAWEDSQPLPFHHLQKRLNRQRVEPSLFHDVPVVFMAYDILFDGKDIRDLSTVERRERLEHVHGSFVDAADRDHQALFRVSPLLAFDQWDAVEAFRHAATTNRTEGVMLKRKDASYGSGRRVGDWWKFKRDPYTLDAVLIAAQRGHGKRATLFTDYTFAIWKDDQLVTIARAYSGLTNDEIVEVDRFVRTHTTATRGPVRMVKPQLVFELGFDDIRVSDRHKAGLALRFPRMLRIRGDKAVADADSVETARLLLNQAEGRS